MPPVTPNWTKGRSLDLLVESYSNAARTIQVRGFTESEPIVINHVTSADRSLVSMTHAITEPPIMLTVRTLETNVKRGACYVKVSLRAEGVVIGLLAAGYVTDAGGPAWPNGKIESSIEGPGLIRSITGTNPAAGAEISETVPTGARWRLLNVRTIFVASATVATRNVTLVLDNGTTTYFRTGYLVDTTAGGTTYDSFAIIGAENGNNSAAVARAIPEKLLLPAGHRIQTQTNNMQVSDNYGAPQMVVEEWIEP